MIVLNHNEKILINELVLEPLPVQAVSICKPSNLLQ